jgi:AbrB family looped-hinge helix DNA binding protein
MVSFQSDAGAEEGHDDRYGTLDCSCKIQCNGIDYWFAPKYRTIMNVHLTIHKAGRVVIPKSLREDLHLEPGDALEMESTGEQITLRPVRGTGPVKKEHSVWVFYTGQPLLASATDEVIEQIRTERDLANLGEER